MNTDSIMSAFSKLGIGWALTGLSSISRMPLDIYHNKGMAPVEFDIQEFALDGQRLFPTSPGASTFNTENKNFAKITKYGTMGMGPSYFIVEYPNGIIYEYGNTTDSKMLGSNVSDVLIWAVNKIYDRNGNYVSFEYFNNQSGGDYRILKIAYTGNNNAGQNPPTEIRFNYTARPDANTCWVDGAITADNAVLSGIEVTHNASMVNKYAFNYDFSSFYMSRLTSITEKRPNNVELPPVVINWGKEDQNYSTLAIAPLAYASANPNGLNDSLMMLGDFNGDGFTDYVCRTPVYGSTTDVKMHLNNKNDDFSPASVSTIPNSVWLKSDFLMFRNRNITVDYNGDGFDDMLSYTHNYDYSLNQGSLGIYKSLSLKTTFSNPTQIFSYYYTAVPHTHGGVPVDNSKILQGDFDGDGKRELLVLIPVDYNANGYECYIVGDQYPNGPVGHQVGSSNGVVVSGDYRYVGTINHDVATYFALDYNGDGRDELLITSATTSTEMYNLNLDYTGPACYGLPGNALSLMYWGTFPSKDHHVYIGDFNGDGKKDLLTWISNGTPSKIGTWDIAYSTGKPTTTTSVFSYQSAPSNLNLYGPAYPDNFKYFVADFDGNGKDDIMQLDSYPDDNPTPWNPIFSIAYSYGNNNFHGENGVLPGFPVAGNNVAVGDFNGDGQADLIWSNGVSGTTTYPVIAYFHKNDIRQLVTSIEHAGKRIEVEHANLPQMTNYSYYPSTTWQSSNPWPVSLNFPYVSRVFPLSVVKNIKDYVSLSHTPLSLNKSYSYSSLVYHMQGLGFQGFARVNIVDSSAVTMTENIFHNTYSQPVTYMQESSTWNLNTYYGVMVNGTMSGIPINTPLMSTVQSMTDWGSGFIHNLTFDISGTNYVNGTTSRNYPVINNVNFFNDYGRPDSVIEIHGPVRIAKGFTYNTGAPFYNIAKPVSITTNTTRENRPTYSETVNYSYNSSGLVDVETSDPGTPHENVLQFAYDAYGNILSNTLMPNSMSVVHTSSVYSSDGRFKIKEKDNMGFESSTSYNVWGAILSSTSAAGFTTYSTYDEINRELNTTLATGAVTSHTYDWAQNISIDNTLFQSSQFCNTITSNGVTNRVFVDFYGRDIRNVKVGFNGQAIYKDTKYLQNGAIDYSTAQYYKNSPMTANITSFSYDAFGRLSTTTSTSGPTLNTYYNLNWKSSTEVSGLSTTTQNMSVPGVTPKTITTDASGVQVVVTDAVNTMKYEYGSHGKVESIKLNNNVDYESQFGYDNYGRRISAYQYNMGTTTYDYNAMDQLVHEQLGSGTNVYYHYDALGRLIQKINPDGTFNYTYNIIAGNPDLGTIASITSPYNTSYTYIYDNFGRVSQFDRQTPSETFTSKYTYDIYNRLVTHEYPEGEVIQRNFNNYGYLESIDLIGGSIPSQKLWKINSKNELDQTTQSEYYDASNNPIYTLNKGYNSGYPQSIVLSTSTAANVVNFSYNFDVLSGNLVSRYDNTKGGSNFHENFTYDAFDRLTSIAEYQNSVNTHNLNLTYDDVGNIKKKDDVTPSTYDWKYNGFALAQVPEPNLSSPSYVLPTPDQILTYNRCKKVKTITEGNQSLEFEYWPDEQRSQVTSSTLIGGNTITNYMAFYVDDYEMERDYTTGIIKSRSLVMADGQIVAILYHDIVPPPPGHPRNQGNILTNTVFYPIVDHLGSITHIFDNQGISNNGLVEERSFDAWGRPRDPNTWQCYNASLGFSQPNWIITRGYTGHEHYPYFGIINMDGRLYDPLVARMFNCDPVLSDATNSQAFNKYSYVNNNPLKYTDPSGNNPAVLLISAVVGGIVNCAVNANRIDSWGTGFKYFGVGFVAGLVGGAAGSAVVGVGASGIAAGIAAGSAGGAAGGFISNAGNAWIRGASIDNIIGAGMTGAGIGSISGAIFGGIGGGISSAIQGRNLWSGQKSPTYIDMYKSFKLRDAAGKKIGILDVQYDDKGPFAHPQGFGRQGIHIKIGYQGSQYKDLNWVQTINATNEDVATGNMNVVPTYADEPSPGFGFYLDPNGSASDKSYFNATWNGNKYSVMFEDMPAGNANLDRIWEGELSLVGKNSGGSWTRIITVKYGFHWINNTFTPDPFIYNVNPSNYHLNLISNLH